MQTKNYTTDLLPLIKAICGVEFSTIELPRIKAMVNRRAKRAYRSTNYWTRFLKIAEERTVTSGVIGYTQGGLDSIDTYLRIYRQDPYQTASVQEFDFMVTASGAELVAGNLAPTSAWVTYKKQFSDTYGDGTGGTTTSVPDEWFEYLAHGVYADFLRAEGQQEKSALADQEANEILQDELMKLDEQHTQQIVANRIYTNANMQVRNS
jgi:hypothetical protein